MKRILFIILMIMPFMGMEAQKEIKLNAPGKMRGTAVMKALADRYSEREFAARELSLQDLSDLLWAANGVNRPDGKRTAPSALNKQDIDIYVVMAKGAYLYNHTAHSLELIAAGDHRAAVAGAQDFVKEAAACLVMVSDLSRFGAVDEHTLLMGTIDAGLVSQNINIFCSAVGLNTVPRVSMDQEILKKILKLSASQRLILNNPVGYRK